MVGLVGIALPRVFENKLNVLLSEILNQMGIVSKSEQIGRGRRDIVAYHQGLQIVLEGSYSRADAENDAKKRIEQLSADLAIAIHYCEDYPQGLTEYEIKERLRKSTFYVKVIVPEDISGTLMQFLYNRKVIAKPAEDWIKVDIQGLANLIKESVQFIISEQHVKEIEKKIENLISDLVDALSDHNQAETMTENIYKILFRLYGFSIGDPKLIKEVIFAQAGLAILLSSIYYESIRYAHGMNPLSELVKKYGPKVALERAFEEILEINYQPVFNVAKEIVRCLPSLPILKRLILVATEIASKKTLLRRDLAGKIYHKIVGEWSLRKGLATFFTSIPAAYLLLYLMNPEVELRIINKNGKLVPQFDVPRICDFACGSGTLLTAAYSATMASLAKNLAQSGIDFAPKDVYLEFHRKFIENCYGFDVLKYATQITAINLAFHNPEAPLEEFNIFTMPLGARREDGVSVSLGSLEFARPNETLTNIFGVAKTTRIGLREEKEEIVKIMDLIAEKFDYIVMNPPFTRATGRGGRESGGLFGFVMESNLRESIIREYNVLRNHIRSDLLATARRLLRNSNLKNLIEDREFRTFTQIGQAGEGLLFLFLAYKMVKEGGKIGFVLPKNMLSGASWFLARTLLLSKFHVEYIVVSYDPECGYNFSESTSLSELLLVAKRTESHSDDEITKFVLLLRKPKTSIEAIALAKQINGGQEYVEVGNAQALVISIDRKTLLEYIDNWGRFVFLPNIYLLEEILDILRGIIRVGDTKIRAPITKLNDLISSIGIDRHQFHDHFQKVSKRIPGALPVIYGGGEEVREKMVISPNAYVRPKSQRARMVFREKAGRLLLPDRIRVNTAHVISMLSDTPVLSNIFYVAKLRDENENKLKALCLWFNTTWGILTVLANREETEGGFISLKMSHWRLVPVLDVNKLEKEQINVLDRLAKIYDKFARIDLGRIPNQYNANKLVNLRVELDKEFLRAFGVNIDDNDLLELYRHIRDAFKQWLD